MRELADRHDRYATEGSREVQGVVNEPSVLSGAGQRDDSIIVVGASQNNLKNISVRIPKKMITVFTGVSGSGKSSLCLDTIAAESRRALNETFPSYIQNYLPRYGRPEVKQIGSLPVCILIDQKKPAGKCPCCDGLGVTTQLDIHKLIDFNKSLNDEDVIHFPTFTTGAWRWKRYANSGLFDNDKKIRDYSAEELDLLLNAPQQKLKDPPKNWPAVADSSTAESPRRS